MLAKSTSESECMIVTFISWIHDTNKNVITWKRECGEGGGSGAVEKKTESGLM